MLDKRYDFKAVEEGKYDRWKTGGYFTAGDKSKVPFSIVIPPPNVTGKLHIGHALDTTMQDIIARYKRMKGFDVCYLPGMDHAGIATQAKVMDKLSKQGIDVTKISREEFLDWAWKWKEEYALSIHEQWKVLGLSLDYTRERFTLDEGLNEAVRKVFVDLFNRGLIYQGERIINWDPVLKTALSNVEVIHQDDPGHMYFFKYRLVGNDEFLIVATTRPETMFGDVCVVVNPNDERYQKYIGLKVINPANGQAIPVIADEYVDTSFGTGVMKCTPAHDPNDFIIGEKYHLVKPIIFNKDASMNHLAGKYEGQDRFVCRENLLKQIKEDDNFVKIEDIIHPVGHSERSHAVVEPMLSKQWFVKMKPLAERSLANQKTGEKVNFIPERFEKVFTQWMEKIEDWCVSRQLWWGHRIPAYTNKKTGELLVSVEAPKDIENWEQDPDVLDTWFSSALWPFSTFGWPEETPDFKRYFPTNVLVTGYDIIFFWVSRMIFQSLEMTGKSPFEEAVIHGLVRDNLGRKMNKSLGNGVDPIAVSKEYGADALRYFLTTNCTPGQDMRYSEEKVVAASNYLNKIWNSARYVLSVLPENFATENFDSLHLSPLDQWIINRLEETIERVTMNMEKYDFNAASTHLYNFVYDDFCSQYLEMSKVSLSSNDEEAIKTTHQVLFKCLKSIILLIYPYTPFISEELYLSLPGHLDSIMLESYPLKEDKLIDKRVNDEVNMLFAMIKDVRNYKIENKLAPNAKLNLYLNLKIKVFDAYFAYLKRFTFSEYQIIGEEILSKRGELRIYDFGDLLIDNEAGKEELLARIGKEIEEAKSEIARAERMLTNENFLAKAPQDKIELERSKLNKHKDVLVDLFEKKKKLS
ncbi:MAG TPA: valine--tRNA ligase [Bacilli bacterium]|jgi:valyl-tRNA synthetase|nr:valine--tRNA ligase [Bacilli bacterium]HPY79427.1 valine--tRNA ligase [Bacilli bacterium]HQA55495.1 valine--tRNA ligase [Bacilli bacterium]